MYTSYTVTILLSMFMDYVSLAWIDSILHVTKGATASDSVSPHMEGRVCGHASAWNYTL